MKSHKLENNIKEKLHSREILPSRQAWDRLDAMLALQEQPKMKKTLLLYYTLAASIVAFAVVLWATNSLNSTEKIDFPQENPVVIQSKNIETTNEIIQEKNSTKPLETSATPSIKVKTNNTYLPKDIQSKSLQNIEIEPIVVVSQNLSPEQLKRAHLLLDAIEQESVSETLNPILKEQNNQITIHVESLLQKAEAEVNQSFREKMIHKVNKNLSTIKEAWVNRNLE